MINIPRYKLLYIFFDLIILSIFLFSTNILFQNGIQRNLDQNILTAFKLMIKLVLCSSLILFIFRSNNLYKINVILNRSFHIKKLFIAWFKIILFGIILAIFFENFLVFNTVNIIPNSIILGSVYILFRVFILTKLYKYISKKYLRNNLLLVGDGNFAKIISAEYFIKNSLPINIIGILNDNLVNGADLFPGIKVLGKTSELKNIVKKFKIDEVILSYNETNYSVLIEKLDELEELNIRVRVSSELLGTINDRTAPETYYEIPVLDFHSIQDSAKMRRFFKQKRIFDLFFSVIGIILLAPIYIFTAIAIKLTSKGPAIYAQERIGKDGKMFKFYKFRSMTIDDDDDNKRKDDMIRFIETNKEGNDEYKVINEKRLTKIGKFIRKTSIDELPQLFNVVKGEMSLVGPRPCLPYEFSKYKNWQMKRLNVLPGCTGFWQIFGRNKVSFLDSTLMDIYYTYVMSPLNDFEYIVKTLPVMIFAKGK